MTEKVQDKYDKKADLYLDPSGAPDEAAHEFVLCLKRAASEAFKFDIANFKDLELSSEKVQTYLNFLNSEELESFTYLLPLSNEKVEELKSATSDKYIYDLLNSGELTDANVCFNYQLYNYIYNDLSNIDSSYFGKLHLSTSKIVEQLSPVIVPAIVNKLKPYQLITLQKFNLNDTSSNLNKLLSVLNSLDYFFTHFDDYSCDNYENPFCMNLPDDDDSDLLF